MTLPLTQYKGPLSLEQAAQGIAFARSNADRLTSDAEILLGAKRYPSAIALAVLAIEELGKVQILKSMILHTDPAELKKSWKEYRSHRAKNVQWILPGLAAEGARTLEQLRAATEAKGEHTALLDAVKQLAFYSDCLGENARWSNPEDAVEPQLAASILGVAKLLNRDKVTEVRELELWVKLVGPHYAKPSMVDALLNFQRQMFEEGLTDIPMETMEAFVYGRPVATPTGK